MNFASLLQSQRNYFASGVTRSLEFRLAMLSKLEKKIRSEEKNIVAALAADLRKPEAEAQVSEIVVSLHEIHTIQRKLKRWMRPQYVGTPIAHWPARSVVLHEPLGTTLIIGPWNYPFQLIIAPLMGAIAGGNTAVLKPSELAPATSALLTRLIREIFPSEYVTVVEGGVEASQALLQEKWDHIFVTGGFRLGQIVMRAAAEHLTPITLELGGKSPCIVDRDANLDVTARRIVWGKFFNSGQTCVAPDYLYVHETIAPTLLEKMRAEIQKQLGGDPQQSADYARIVNDRHFDRLVSLIPQNKIFTGGTHDRSQKYIAPTILSPITWQDKIMEEEIFGPLLPVLKFSDIREVTAAVQARPKPLALYYFSESSQRSWQILNTLSFGGGCVNDCILHLSNPNLPFGGVGASGLGRYHGRYSFETFSHKKSVTLKSTHLDFSLRYPPFRSKFKLSLLKRVLLS